MNISNFFKSGRIALLVTFMTAAGSILSNNNVQVVNNTPYTASLHLYYPGVFCSNDNPTVGAGQTWSNGIGSCALDTVDATFQNVPGDSTNPAGNRTVSKNQISIHGTTGATKYVVTLSGDGKTKNFSIDVTNAGY